MQARIQLDRPHAHFTNLDHITGRVILSLTTSESVASIVVKLEGESKTRLSGPRLSANNERRSDRTEVELHKVLYKVAEVFPSKEIKQRTSSTAGYTLKAGQYEYPFEFKLPMNNNCQANNGLISALNFSGSRLDIGRDAEPHCKNTLPPSLTGFPGEADIRYYVKVTVQRPKFYQENRRAFAAFRFLPIEPPRPEATKQETYARRQHEFAPGPPAVSRRGLFDSGKKSAPPPRSSEQARFRVDARLPNPAIITCNEPLPLRVLVQKQSASSESAILQMIQIELIGYTHVRAHDLTRVEVGSWVIMSYSNMSIPLGDGNTPEGTDIKIDEKLWKNIPIPNTVAPSFYTCNIRRSYELEVRVGLGYGSVGKIRPELIVLPLRLPVEVYSGIAPPRALLEALAKAQRPEVASPTVAPPYTAGPSGASNPYPGQAGPATSTSPEDLPPPPSYEDAIAEDIAPVDGLRRDYADMPAELDGGGPASSSSTGNIQSAMRGGRVAGGSGEKGGGSADSRRVSFPG